jgi:hypothetical protein
MKKSGLIFLLASVLVVSIFASSFISASWFSETWAKITGNAISITGEASKDQNNKQQCAALAAEKGYVYKTQWNLLRKCNAAYPTSFGVVKDKTGTAQCCVKKAKSSGGKITSITKGANANASAYDVKCVNLNCMGVGSSDWARDVVNGSCSKATGGKYPLQVNSQKKCCASVSCAPGYTNLGVGVKAGNTQCSVTQIACGKVK